MCTNIMCACKQRKNTIQIQFKLEKLYQNSDTIFVSPQILLVLLYLNGHIPFEIFKL